MHLHTMSPACCAFTQTHSRQPANASSCCPCVFQCCPIASVFALHVHSPGGTTRLRPRCFTGKQQEVKLAPVPCKNVSACVACLCRVDGSLARTCPLVSRRRVAPLSSHLRAPQSLSQLQCDHRFEANSFSNCQDAAPQEKHVNA